MVSNTGKIKALPKFHKTNKDYSSIGYMQKEKILSVYYDKKSGYGRIGLTKNGKTNRKYIHRLVAEAFLNNPNNCPEVNHIDGNKENNNVNNLEWCNHSDNIKHSYVILGRKQNTMKPIYSRNEKGIKKYDSKADAIQYLKTIGYEKCNYARINVAIKTKGVAYGFRWDEELIDLIEVGDIVEIFDVLNEDVIYIWSEEMLKALKEDIKNGIRIRRILTHEQFEVNSYKV